MISLSLYSLSLFLLGFSLLCSIDLTKEGVGLVFLALEILFSCIVFLS